MTPAPMPNGLITDAKPTSVPNIPNISMPM
jgi:hypothetical protein